MNIGEAINIVILTLALIAFWFVVAATADRSTARTVEIAQPPQGFALECVDNPDQTMICKAYCGEGHPRPERPHP